MLHCVVCVVPFCGVFSYCGVNVVMCCIVCALVKCLLYCELCGVLCCLCCAFLWCVFVLWF